MTEFHSQFIQTAANSFIAFISPNKNCYRRKTSKIATHTEETPKTATHRKKKERKKKDSLFFSGDQENTQTSAVLNVVGCKCPAVANAAFSHFSCSWLVVSPFRRKCLMPYFWEARVTSPSHLSKKCY